MLRERQFAGRELRLPQRNSRWWTVSRGIRSSSRQTSLSNHTCRLMKDPRWTMGLAFGYLVWVIDPEPLRVAYRSETRRYELRRTLALARLVPRFHCRLNDPRLIERRYSLPPAAAGFGASALRSGRSPAPLVETSGVGEPRRRR